MKIRIVSYEDVDSWILGKFAQKLCQEVKSLGYQCEVGSEPDPTADINHHIIYYYYSGQKTTIDTVMITHIDADWKLEKVRAQLAVAKMGICMSDATVAQLSAAGIPREKLSYVLPAHDQIMKPRPIVIGLTSRIYNDGRKRQDLLVSLAERISPELFAFKIMGAGWDAIVTALREKGFNVEYHNAFDYELNRTIVPTFDYYLYLGLDEGAMGFVDALAAGVPTIVTPQGYHLEAPNGITYPFVSDIDLYKVFEKIARERYGLINSVKSWTWKEHALRHLEIWNYLFTGQVYKFSAETRADGIESLIHEREVVTEFNLNSVSLISSVERAISNKLNLGAVVAGADIVKIINTVDYFVEQGVSSTAIDVYKEWISLSQSPLKFAAQFNLAVLHESLAQDNEAIASYKSTLTLKQDFAPAMFNLANLYEKQGNLDDAKSLWDWLIHNLRFVEENYTDVYKLINSRIDYYKELFTKDPYWSSTAPNGSELLRWSRISKFLNYFAGDLELRLQRRPRILEVGSGRGWLTNLLNSYGDAIGVEPVGVVVEHAKKLFPGNRYLHGTTQTLFDAEPRLQFDIIVSSEVIEHVRDSEKHTFVQNMYNLLSPGGFVVLTTPRKEVLTELLHRGFAIDQPVEEWLTEEELRKLYIDNGMQPLEMDRIFARRNDLAGFPDVEVENDEFLALYQVWLFQKPMQQMVSE